MSDDLKERLDKDEGDYHTEEILAALKARDKEIALLRTAGEECFKQCGHLMNQFDGLEARAEAAEAKVARLCEAGGQAANVCYNLAQAQRLEDRQRDTAQSAYKKWVATLADKEPDDG